MPTKAPSNVNKDNILLLKPACVMKIISTGGGDSKLDTVANLEWGVCDARIVVIQPRILSNSMQPLFSKLAHYAMPSFSRRLSRPFLYLRSRACPTATSSAPAETFACAITVRLES